MDYHLDQRYSLAWWQEDPNERWKARAELMAMFERMAIAGKHQTISLYSDNGQPLAVIALYELRSKG